MSTLANLSVLAMRGLAFGACQAVGVMMGDTAAAPVSRFLTDRLVPNGPRLQKILERANDYAWNVLEMALTGEALWDRCSSVFSRGGDDKQFRDQLRAFLDCLPARTLDAPGPEFRRLALEELRFAKKEGALRVSALDMRQLAHQVGRLATYATPESLLAAENGALAEIADSFPGDRYANFRKLLTLTSPDGTPLLTAAVRYFVRREIERDDDLFRGLAFALLERQSEALESGFRRLAALQAEHGDKLERLMSGVLEVATLTHDEVVKISTKLDVILARHHMTGRELRPDDSLLSISEDERRLVRELVKNYRGLPQEQRSGRVELAFKVGQAEALTGHYAEAKKDFEAAALLAPDVSRQAEAHQSAFQAALAQHDLNGAMASVLEAARLDPGRFAPFPLEKYRPVRLLGAGGFGTAFLCRHAFKRDSVVVKALWAAGLDRSIDDVFNEAQALAGLSHSGIIQVIDCDYADRDRRERPYVVMEFFDGPSLAEHVEKHGTLSPGAFLPLARQIAGALLAAHQKGVLHRDVKPANLLVRRPAAGVGAASRAAPDAARLGSPGLPTASDGDWQLKLIDFGLALRPATLAATCATSDAGRQTIVGGSIAGTWKYAAPEQLGDAPGVVVGPYSDVFAFGRTCYFALLGTPEPDDEEKEQLPEPWRRLLSRCTARVAARRPQTFAEVLEELSRLGGAAPTPVTPTPVVVPLPPLEPLKPLPPLPPLEFATPRPPPPRPVRPRSRPVSLTSVRATCLNELVGHDGTVSAVAFRPDGRLIASGGFDDKVRLWGLPSGECLLVLDEHKADVNAVAFSPDGQWLASAADDRAVRLWRMPGGQPGPVLRHPDRVYAVAFHPENRLGLTPPLLATGCDDFKARVWSLETGTTTLTLPGHSSFVRHVAFSPDGRRGSAPPLLATAGGDRLVHLWNITDGKRVTSLVGHTHTVWSVAFSPDGRLAATGSQDRTARIWDVTTGRVLHTLEGHEEIVWSVAFSPDGQLVATASHDRSIRLWNVHDGRCLSTLYGHGGLVRSLAFSPDGRRLATAGGDGKVFVWLLHDDAERCDWSGGLPPLPPRPRVSITRAGNGVVYPGDELWLNVEVENTGRGDLVQLRASVESESPLLRQLHALFGRVRPGEKVSRCMGVLVPRDFAVCELRGQLVFHEGNEYQPAAEPVVFNVHGLPRDDFVLRWKLVDDGTGNSFGAGDGKPRRGECIDVVAAVENRTGQDLEGLSLTLQAVQVPPGVTVNVARSELPPLPDGSSAEGRVTFSARPVARTGRATFELRVEADDGRLFACAVVETSIE